MTTPVAVIIGSIIWVLDDNKRTYKPEYRGGRAPVFRDSFVPFKVVAETRESWILEGGEGLKVNKRTSELRGANLFGKHRRVYFTPAEIDDAVFVNEHRYDITKAVERCDNAAVLRQIQALIKET